MNVAIASFVVCLAVTDLPTGAELKYSGTLHHLTKSDVTEVKSFSLYAVGSEGESGTPQLAYYIDDRGGWGWPERFGLVPQSKDGPSTARSISILYTFENQQYPISVRPPVFEYRDKLVPGATWKEGRREYAVTRQQKIGDRDCFEVEVTSNLGRVQLLVVEAISGILVSLEQKVIIGRGDEFQLKLDLQSQSQLAGDDLANNRKSQDALLALQTSLNRTGDQKIVELTLDQFKDLRKKLPTLQKEAEGTSWARVFEVIDRDLKRQQSRLEGVADLKEKLVGQPAPNWSLKLIDGRLTSDADWKGKILVLHFWQYRGEPLNEPYGQIGYLDFLYSKRKKLGANVIGVNVDERFTNPQQKSAALRSMKGLLDFMRISYDMATDDGTILAKFGDPRSLGTPLPLWVVIGHDGNVAHVHTGFYDIKPDEGLKQLDEAVIDAIRKQKAN